MSVHYWRISDGNLGVMQTVDFMRRMMLTPSPAVREQAEAILIAARMGPHASDDLRANAIYAWVQKKMVYTADASHPVETDHGPDVLDEELRSPDYLLQRIAIEGRAAGDCDDYVILMGALLASVGVSFRIALISTKPDKVFDHVYLRLIANGRAMDAITGQPFGWEVPFHQMTAFTELPL
jgi:transglutaminase-like putative cysteine protease